MGTSSRHFPREMYAFYVGETLACSLFFYFLLAHELSHPDMAALNYAVLSAFTLGTAALCVGIYRAEVLVQWQRLLTRAVVAAGLSIPFICAIGYLVPINGGHVSVATALQAAQVVLCWAGLILATRVLFSLALQTNLLGRRVVVFGSSPASRWIRDDERGIYEVRGASPSRLDPADGLPRDKVWALVVDAEAAERLSPDMLLACQRRRIRVLRDSTFLETCLQRLDLATVTSSDLVGRHVAPRIHAIVTRGFDIVFSLLLLVAVLPVMLLTALAIKFEDGGPVFYPQNRVGLNGREFTLFKFRSMRIDAEARGPVWAQQRDPRITRIGAFIRRVRIDELPQLLNILRGEMSVIGPRPERPHFVQQLAQTIPCYADRAQVKPGLTGWAQVNYPYGASIEDARAKLSYDLYYVKHRSMLLNLKIVFATVRVVLFQEGSR
jgi:exopolysaccharide biosynthesis polyprenyl glycosylphosphotransferase